MMSKTSFGAALAFLFAAAGALTAAALYLHRREKELDEYEKLLFSDDMDDDVDEDYEEEHFIPAEEPAAEQDKPGEEELPF